MLYTIAVILVIAWLLGFVGTFTLDRFTSAGGELGVVGTVTNTVTGVSAQTTLDVLQINASCRILQSAAGPVWTFVAAADDEGHQRGPVVEVDAGPVPAARFARQIFARPFVIEP